MLLRECGERAHVHTCSVYSLFHIVYGRNDACTIMHRKKEHMTRIDTAPFMDNVFFVCLFEKKKKK